MYQCLSTAKVSLLINGSPFKEFSPERGLRQGCPLSPLLFIIAVEGLAQIIKLAKVKNLFSGVSGQNWEASLIQFTDDSLIFIFGDPSQVLNIKHVLRWFQLLSGLKINYSKSSLFKFNISQDSTNNIASLFSCKSSSLLFKYLDIPLGANPRKSSIWKLVIDKINYKLAGWKGKLLSIVERLTLIKASLYNLPLYFLSLFNI